MEMELISLQDKRFFSRLQRGHANEGSHTLQQWHFYYPSVCSLADHMAHKKINHYKLDQSK